MFNGLTEDAYRFFWELAFNNEKPFFEANRERYKQCVSVPMQKLAALLTPTILEIDDRLNVRPASVVSRIRRDTRFSKDKSMYRDHVWLGYKMPGSRVSENFVLYAEFERTSYGYGMGMYAPNAAMMRPMQARMLAKPQKFLSLVTEPTFVEQFTVDGETYKRPRYSDVPEALFTYINRKNISFYFSSEKLSNTMKPEIFDEINHAFQLLKPVYRFLMGLD
ncbi:MAG: DUF2461 domain-containing protein [Clostridia bacterium]